MSEKYTFTDWILDLSFSVFFWGMIAVVAVLWAVAMFFLWLFMLFIGR